MSVSVVGGYVIPSMMVVKNQYEFCYFMIISEYFLQVSLAVQLDQNCSVYQLHEQ